MSAVVVDTNVLVVAEGQHDDVSLACRAICIDKLAAIRAEKIVVLDDGYRILSEYQNNLDTRRGKGVGSAFLKWLFQNQANSQHVQQVTINEPAPGQFAEFPAAALAAQFDPSDRKFPAVANAHPAKPPILQAVDCKWLDWWQPLQTSGICVEFVCPEDVCRFYKKKFPDKPEPSLPK